MHPPASGLFEPTPQPPRVLVSSFFFDQLFSQPAERFKLPSPRQARHF